MANESRRAFATQTAPRARAPGYLPNKSPYVDMFVETARISHLSTMFISLPVLFLKS